MDPKNYNAKHVVIDAAGRALTGMGEDGFISIKPKTPAFSSKVGVDGMVVRSRSNDNRYDIEITMLAASPSNAHLMALYMADFASGAAPFPLNVSDLHGRFVATMPVAWVVQAPDLAAAREEGMVVWKLEGVGNPPQFAGSAV